jgi:SAM-dependent methyltransferase
MCAVDWDQRYRDNPEKWLTPDPWFVAVHDQFVASAFPQPGCAFDLAGGMGRHALYLAERGWDVTLNDVSGVALSKAQQLASERGLTINTEQCDLSARPVLPLATYDLIVVFFFLDRTLLPGIAAALRPGGMLVYKTYTLEQLKLGKGPSGPDHLLNPGELRTAFQQLNVVSYQESVAEKAVAELVARRETA